MFKARWAVLDGFPLAHNGYLLDYGHSHSPRDLG